MNTKNLKQSSNVISPDTGDTYTVTLESAQLCGDPQLTVSFSLSPVPSSAVKVTWIAVFGKYEKSENAPATYKDGHYTATMSVEEGQIKAGDKVHIIVDVNPNWSNGASIKSTACKN